MGKKQIPSNLQKTGLSIMGFLFTSRFHNVRMVLYLLYAGGVKVTALLKGTIKTEGWK